MRSRWELVGLRFNGGENDERGKPVSTRPDATRSHMDHRIRRSCSVRAARGAVRIGEGLDPMSVDAFADEFDRLREVPELAGNIQKVGNCYFGIKLRSNRVPKLPVPRRDAG
jgi:hypothetical protein